MMNLQCYFRDQLVFLRMHMKRSDVGVMAWLDCDAEVGGAVRETVNFTAGRATFRVAKKAFDGMGEL